MSLKNLAKLVNQAVKEKPLEQEFLTQLNEAIGRTSKNSQPSKTYKPSSLGGCLRKVYFEVTGAPLDPNTATDPALVGISESGTDRHDRIQRIISKMKDMNYDLEWVDVEEYLALYPQEGTKVVSRVGLEVKLFNSIFNMSFMCDGIVKFKGVYYILEIKTETSFKWQSRQEPEQKHIVQASCYSMALGLNNIIFLYENRDVCAKKCYFVTITDQQRFENVVDKIETCNDFIIRNVVPDKTEKVSECNYCNFKNECQKW